MLDARHCEGIDLGTYYKPESVAGLLDCHVDTVYTMCPKVMPGPRRIDSRHLVFRRERNYRTDEIANRLQCSASLIRKLRNTGQLEWMMIGSTKRIPGWSINDYIKANVPEIKAHQHKIDHVRIGSLIRVPGWAMVEFLKYNASNI
jgi:hypothetical protein